MEDQAPSPHERAAPLSAEAQRTGRRLAIASHPLGMTFAMVLSQHLPTLALVALGASEAMVGLQSAFVAFELLMLPTLGLVAFVSKRTLLVCGHTAALACATPLLFYDLLLEGARAGDGRMVIVALICLGLVSACMKVGDTVWFPLLRGYVEPQRIGRFFGTLRSGWHLALIVYYLGARAWLDAHPQDFGPLFAVAFACGVLRIFLIARLPERSERAKARIRIREAVALIRERAGLGRYIAGAGLASAIRTSILPFVLVMMEREVGFGAGQLLYTTAATYAGGLISLYGWGRVVDRIGAEPVFRTTSLVMGALCLGLTLVETPGPATLMGVIGFFFLYAVMSAGFGVADTHVLFQLAPADAPTRTLVIAAVTIRGLGGLVPLGVGLTIEGLLGRGAEPLVVYHGFFAIAALLQAAAFLPLRGITKLARGPHAALDGDS